jgi:hypothetical protein
VNITIQLLARESKLCVREYEAMFQALKFIAILAMSGWIFALWQPSWLNNRRRKRPRQSKQA